MHRYVALENINYDTLQLNKKKCQPPTPEWFSPDTLLSLSCHAVCQCSATWPGLAQEAVGSVPAHLAPALLQAAIRTSHAPTITTIIAHWPLHTLSFQDVLGDQRSVFEEEMGLDLVVFNGVTRRTPRCAIQVIDFRGFTLSATFTRLMIQMWPILSLKKSQRNVKRLTSRVLRVAGVRSEVASEMIPRLLRSLLSSDMAQHPAFSIHIPKGRHMVVKLDRLEFSSHNSFFMDYLISNSLRSLAPVSIQASSIVIRSELSAGDEVLDSLAPFIVFRGQQTEGLEGIWLENLEDNVFFRTSPHLHDFSHIRGLGVPNCNIMLLAGRTRRRTSPRRDFTSVLRSFSNLTRLDVSQNCFAGCLHEVLDALRLPLHYLCLRECDLLDRDIEGLAASRHARSLKQLNVSKICGLFPEDSFAVNPSTLVRRLRHFTAVQVVHMQQNQITDQRISEVCEAIRQQWTQLKALNISDNMFSGQNALRIVEACVLVPSMQLLKVPYLHNLYDAINPMENGRQEFKGQVAEILARNKRCDIEVEVFNVVSYGAFLNI